MIFANCGIQKKTDLKRRDVEGKEIQIIVGMGTCGLAAGAKGVVDTFLRLLGEHNLVEGVLVRQTGCMGLCSVEPTVEIAVPGMPAVVYGPVDETIAETIVSKHIIGRELLDDLIRDKPAADIV